MKPIIRIRVSYPFISYEFIKGRYEPEWGSKYFVSGKRGDKLIYYLGKGVYVISK